MKVAQVSGDKIGINEVPDIELCSRKGAIVKVLGSGLCGSDIIKFEHKTVPNGTVLGHEIVAQILEVDTNTDFKVGDIIVSTHHIPCGKCEFCKSGNVSMCRHFKRTNIYPGGFSEKVFLSEEHLRNVAYLKPQNLTEVEASFYEPLSCCVRAIRRAELSKGSEALVVGLGSIGILMAQALKAAGMKVVGVDLLPKRVKLAKNYGIDAVLEVAGSFHPNVVFLTAGADKAVASAIKIVRDGGKIIIFSSTPNNVPFPNNEIYYRELTVMGSYSPDLCDMKESLRLLESGDVKVSGLSTVYPLEELEKAILDTRSNKIVKAYIKV